MNTSRAVVTLHAVMFDLRRGFGLSVAVLLLLLTALAGCGGDDDGEEDDKNAEPVAGSFVSKVEGSEAFVSVVAAPPAKGKDERMVSVLVCDAESLCQEFSGTATGNSFTAKSAGDGGEAKGTLSADEASGTIEPPDGETLRYKAASAPATSGLYDLTVSREGKLRGASAAGVALKGTLELPPPGTGTLKLADGKRLKLEVLEASGDVPRLRPGQVRLIVLPDRQARGAGKARGSDESDFFLRSASK